VEDQVTYIKRKIDVLFEEIKNLKDNAKSESNFDNLLDKANVKARVNNILRRIAYLSEKEKSRLSISNLQHLQLQQYK
jgi:carbonic anhydrase